MCACEVGYWSRGHRRWWPREDDWKSELEYPRLPELWCWWQGKVERLYRQYFVGDWELELEYWTGFVVAGGGTSIVRIVVGKQPNPTCGRYGREP